MVLNAGIVNIMDLLAGDAGGKQFTQIVVGTSNAPVTGTETALTGQIAKNIASWNNLGNGFIIFNSTLDAGDPAMVIQEMGLLNQSGVLCYRVVISPVSKVLGVTFSINYKIRIQ
jgi:hypothetical protein